VLKHDYIKCELMHRNKLKLHLSLSCISREMQHDITLVATMLCLTKLLLYVVVMQHEMFEWL